MNKSLCFSQLSLKVSSAKYIYSRADSLSYIYTDFELSLSEISASSGPLFVLLRAVKTN